MRALKRGIAAASAGGLAIGLVLVGTGTAAHATAPLAVTYQLTISPDGVSDYFGINTAGDVLGEGTAPGATDPQPVIVKAGTTTPIFLQSATPSTPAKNNGINDLGHAVGFIFDSPTRALEWTDPNAPPTDISGDTTAQWSTNAINANDDIVGEKSVDAPAPQELLTTPWLRHNGVITDLPTLAAGQDATPAAINNNGLVVGTADATTFTSEAVEWQNGQITPLGTLGTGDFAEALAVNNNGVAVGESNSTPGVFTTSAVMFANGTVTQLNVAQGGQFAQANGINDSGVIIGQDGNGEPYVYQNGQETDLNTVIPASSNVTLFTASGINNAGDIVGSGIFFDSTTGVTRSIGYELAPVTGGRP